MTQKPPDQITTPTTPNQRMTIITEGYAAIDKTVSHIKGNSPNVYLPQSWKHKRVRIILLETLD